MCVRLGGKHKRRSRLVIAYGEAGFGGECAPHLLFDVLDRDVTLSPADVKAAAAGFVVEPSAKRHP
jgi:hypothetical protein